MSKVLIYDDSEVQALGMSSQIDTTSYVATWTTSLDYAISFAPNFDIAVVDWQVAGDERGRVDTRELVYTCLSNQIPVMIRTTANIQFVESLFVFLKEMDLPPQRVDLLEIPTLRSSYKGEGLMEDILAFEKRMSLTRRRFESE